jgi:hypothetical protein
MAQRIKVPSTYSSAIAQLSRLVAQTSVDGRCNDAQRSQIRRLAGELTNELIKAHNAPLQGGRIAIAK